MTNFCPKASDALVYTTRNSNDIAFFICLGLSGSLNRWLSTDHHDQTNDERSARAPARRLKPPRIEFDSADSTIPSLRDTKDTANGIRGDYDWSEASQGYGFQ